MTTTPMSPRTVRSSAPLPAAPDLTPDGDDAFLGTLQGGLVTVP
jgi:hypothetical protein